MACGRRLAATVATWEAKLAAEGVEVQGKTVPVSTLALAEEMTHAT